MHLRKYFNVLTLLSVNITTFLLLISKLKTYIKCNILNLANNDLLKNIAKSSILLKRQYTATKSNIIVGNVACIASV